MNKQKMFLVLFSIFVATTIFSQENSPKKWAFAFQLDNRFSSILNTNITIFGAKIGVQYKNLTRFGLGTSFIVNPVSIEYFNRKLKVQETNTINFWYVSLFNDWIVYKNKNWECYLTEQIGFGKPKYTREIDDEIVTDVNVGLVLNEISGQVNYKINNWVGVGAGVGYRSLLNKNGLLKNTFEAPIYIVKVIIYPEGIF